MLGAGLYLILTSLPFGRPKRDLGERFRRLDVDERVRVLQLGPAVGQRLFTVRLLDNMLRPIVEDVGRGLRALVVRLGIGGGRELELRLRLMRPGVEARNSWARKLPPA